MGSVAIEAPVLVQDVGGAMSGVQVVPVACERATALAAAACQTQFQGMGTLLDAAVPGPTTK